jgi:alpha-amylase
MRILHLFNWLIKDIINNLDVIAYQRFDGIQINPVQPLKQDGYEPWWLSYQPCGFRIDNQYGSKEEVTDLCSRAGNYNIRIIPDVILNHMAGKNNGSLFPHEKVEAFLRNNPSFWKDFQNISNWQNRDEIVHKCIGLPGLNTANHELQDIIINFLNELIDCGAGGFRFDAAKNIALPDENCDFWPRVIYCLKKYGLFLYGEIIFEDSYLIDRYCKYFNVLSDNCGSNKDSMVAFVESHDTYNEFGYTKNKSSQEIAREYYQLTKQFQHTIFYARPYDDTWRDDIIRKANEESKVYCYK